MTIMLRRLLLSCVILTIPSCAKMTAISGIDWRQQGNQLKACDLPYRTWSSKDTNETIIEAKAFNLWKKNNCEK